jgi:hypothetical protein
MYRTDQVVFDRWIDGLTAWFRQPAIQLSVLGLILGVLALTAARIYRQYDTVGGPYELAQGGMFDFHNGVYQPALGLRDGVIPYSLELVEKYQVTRPTPAFSPFIIAVHIPLTFLPMHVAESVYFGLTLGLMILAAWLVLSEAAPDRSLVWLGPLTLCMLVSRAGHITLYTGYFTMELVWGTLVALKYAEQRPWWAAVGILFASGKPTFAIPLGLVLWARGNYRALMLGVGLSAIGAAIPCWYLARIHGWSNLVEAFRTGQREHLADPSVLPVNSWTRIDLPGGICKWLQANPEEAYLLLGMLLLIAWPLGRLYQLRAEGDRQGATTTSGMIALLAILTTIYHHAYDGLLVIGLFAGLVFSSPPAAWKLGWLSRLILVVLVTSPLWNYGSTESVLRRLPEIPMAKEILSSANSLMLAMGLVWFLWMTSSSRFRQTSDRSPGVQESRGSSASSISGLDDRVHD